MSTPYTYLVGWSNHNRYYYGRRTGKNCSPADLWVSYFTSSVHVARFRTEYGEPDVILVRKVFSNVEKCRIWEEKVLRRLNAAQNVVFLNKRNGDKSNRFNTNGTAHAKDAGTGERLGTVSIHDPRWKTGQIVGIRRGQSASDETKAKMSANRKNTAIGRIIKTGKRQRISLDDPRWKSGEVVSILTGVRLGVAQSPEHIKKRSDSRKQNGKKNV